MTSERGIDLSDDQLEVIIHDLLDLYGFDFRGYSKPSLKRRLSRLISHDRFSSFAAFRFGLKEDKEYVDRLVEQITVSVTEMFRDPGFFRVLREKVLSELSFLPVIR